MSNPPGEIPSSMPPENEPVEHDYPPLPEFPEMPDNVETDQTPIKGTTREAITLESEKLFEYGDIEMIRSGQLVIEDLQLEMKVVQKGDGTTVHTAFLYAREGNEWLHIGSLNYGEGELNRVVVWPEKIKEYARNLRLPDDELSSAVIGYFVDRAAEPSDQGPGFIDLELLDDQLEAAEVGMKIESMVGDLPPLVRQDLVLRIDKGCRLIMDTINTNDSAESMPEEVAVTDITFQGAASGFPDIHFSAYNDGRVIFGYEPYYADKAMQPDITLDFTPTEAKGEALLRVLRWAKQIAADREPQDS